jgi:hypothetical protein
MKTSWRGDLVQIAMLFTKQRFPEGEHQSRINQARERARPILIGYQVQVLKLTDLLTQRDIDRAEFERLMIM